MKPPENMETRLPTSIGKSLKKEEKIQIETIFFCFE
jgi:hypothetical protein